MLGRDEGLAARLAAQLDTWPFNTAMAPEAPIDALQHLLRHVEGWEKDMEGQPSQYGIAFADSIRAVLAGHLLDPSEGTPVIGDKARLQTVDYVGALQELDLVFRQESPGDTELAFVEVETPNGYSVALGTWRKDEDGWHRLRIRVPVTDLDENSRDVVRTHG